MIKLNGKKVDIGHFPDGTLLIKEAIEKDYKTERSANILWKFENNEELVALIYLTGHLKSKGIKNIGLDMPYIPNARQDRVKCDEDVFTLKYFSEVINGLGFSSVTVFDPHSSVSEALINNIIVKSPDKYIDKIISLIGDDNLIIFYPDEGAMKRYSGMIDRPYTFGIKKRDWKTGKINGLEVSGQTELICGSRVLIIDDISSRGGTFYHSAQSLKKLGAGDVYLYISHCENTILEGEVLKGDLVKRVFTTNSLFTANNEKIEVFDYE